MQCWNVLTVIYYSCNHFILKHTGNALSGISPVKQKTREYAPLHIFTLPLIIGFILLTWPQEEVYQSRHGCRLQVIWVCGLEDMARQWKGRRGRWSRKSKHWTSRDLMPPSQFLEHWEKTRHDCYSNSMSCWSFKYPVVVSLRQLVLMGFITHPLIWTIKQQFHFFLILFRAPYFQFHTKQSYQSLFWIYTTSPQPC